MSSLSSAAPAVLIGLHSAPPQSRVERIVFFGLGTLLLFGPLAFGAVESWAIFAQQAVAVGLVMLWISAWITNSRIHAQPNPLYFPWAALAVLVLLQILLRVPPYLHSALLAAAAGVTYLSIFFLANETFKFPGNVRAARRDQAPTPTSATPTAPSRMVPISGDQCSPVARSTAPAASTASEWPRPQRAPNPAALGRAGRWLTNAVTATMWSTSSAWTKPSTSAVPRASRAVTLHSEAIWWTSPATSDRASGSPRSPTAPVEPASSAAPSWRRCFATCPRARVRMWWR